MAKKSKTQRAKASAARQARKEQKAVEEAAALAKAEQQEEEPEKKGLKARLSKKREESQEKAKAQQAQQAQQKKVEKAPVKKSRFQFLKDVRAELKRVTWPSRQDVFRWSLVVVAALLFFGIYVAVLDNVIITPLLVAVSGLGA